MAGKSRVQRFCGDQMTAKAFIDNSETREILKRQHKDLTERGFLPADMSQRIWFDVYWLQPSSFGSHASLVFTSNQKHCVTAEIQWYVPDGVHHVLPFANGFKWSEHPERTRNMKKCGRVLKSADKLIAAGIRAAKRFGGYGKYTNNCQNYCNCVLGSVGLRKRWTDIGIVLACSNVLAPLVYLAMMLREDFWSTVCGFILLVLCLGLISQIGWVRELPVYAKFWSVD